MTIIKCQHARRSVQSVKVHDHIVKCLKQAARSIAFTKVLLLSCWEDEWFYVKWTSFEKNNFISSLYQVSNHHQALQKHTKIDVNQQKSRVIDHASRKLCNITFELEHSCTWEVFHQLETIESLVIVWLRLNESCVKIWSRLRVWQSESLIWCEMIFEFDKLDHIIETIDCQWLKLRCDSFLSNVLASLAL